MRTEKKYFVLLLVNVLLIFLSSSLTGQNKDRHFIQLKDKNNSPYSIQQPQFFLSQKAIERRQKQKIAIELSDLPVNPSYISEIRDKGATILYSLKWLNGVVIQTNSPSVLNAIRNLPFVVNAKTVNYVKPKMIVERVDPIARVNRIYSNSTEIYDYGYSLNQIEMLNGICMHTKGFNGKGISIGVIDAGFAFVDKHPAFDSLRVNNQILGTKDFTFLSPENIYSSSTSGHGTAVLGTMGAHVSGQLIGTAPKANYWLIRSEYAPSEYLIEEYNWEAAVEFADSVGVDIINSSLGYTTFDDPSQDYTMDDLNGKTSVCSKAATYCARKGIIVCTSAGNSGGSNWPKIGFPGDADSILTVGAVDANKNYAGFSSIGPTSDSRIKPEISAQGSSSVVANASGGIGTSSGTSFSSPIIAGMVACLWQANPERSNMEIMDAVKKSSSLYSAPNNQLGYGIPDFCEANSKINAIRTVAFNETKIVIHSANPFSDKIKMSIQHISSQMDVEILDLSGKPIFKTTYFNSGNSEKEIELNTGHLSSGIYFLKIYSAHKTKSLLLCEKLVKVNN